MSSGRRDDIPDLPPGSVPEPPEDDGLLTSEDLFGDLVDAVPEPTPPRPSEPRKAPVRVQVPEPGAARRPDRAPMPKEVLPEDMAALLDAFSGPGEAAVLADVPPPALEGPDPLSADPVEGLLEDLSAAEALPLAVPPPAAPVAEVDILLDGLEGPELMDLDSPEALLPSPLETLAPDEAPVLEEEIVVDLEPSAEMEAPIMLEADAEPEPSLFAPEDDLLAGVLGPEEEPPSPAPTPTNSFMDIPGLRELLAAAKPGGAEPPHPASRTATKFQATAPKRNAPVEGDLDLASLAEDALFAAEHDAADPQAGAALDEHAYGPYRLVERVAVGGMAEVFRAKRSGVEGFEKIVAVKRILPHLSDNKEFVDMFIDEAKLVAGLTHPNIVQIFDLGKIEKSYYIAMEYVHGRDLRTILRSARERGLRLPLDLSVLIVGRVCAALEYAHRARDDQGRAMWIVHRDISPQNILISFEGDVKLTDFGITNAATKATVTDAGALRGKLLYMSPEQAWGKPMDRRSDVFSLGIVFYEMVTDQKPFLGTSEMSILEMVRECRITAPSSFNPRLPEKIEKVILKALERDPDERYQDAAEMARDLERVLRERQPPTPVELARYMELLFDEAAQEGTAQEDAQRQEEAPGRGLEIELDTGPEMPAEEKTSPGPTAPDQKSIQRLLKRFGIK